MTTSRTFEMCRLAVGDLVKLHFFSDDSGDATTTGFSGLVVVAGDMPTLTVIEQEDYTALTVQLLGTLTLCTEMLSPFRMGVIDNEDGHRLVYVHVGLGHEPPVEMPHLRWIEIRRPGKKGGKGRLIWNSQ